MPAANLQHVLNSIRAEDLRAARMTCGELASLRWTARSRRARRVARLRRSLGGMTVPLATILAVTGPCVRATCCSDPFTRRYRMGCTNVALCGCLVVTHPAHPDEHFRDEDFATAAAYAYAALDEELASL